MLVVPGGIAIYIYLAIYDTIRIRGSRDKIAEARRNTPTASAHEDEDEDEDEDECVRSMRTKRRKGKLQTKSSRSWEQLFVLCGKCRGAIEFWRVW